MLLHFLAIYLHSACLRLPVPACGCLPAAADQPAGDVAGDIQDAAGADQQPAGRGPAGGPDAADGSSRGGCERRQTGGRYAQAALSV